MRYFKISEQQLRHLLEYADELNCLYENGVENWDGYSYFKYRNVLRQKIDALIKNFEAIKK